MRVNTQFMMDQAERFITGFEDDEAQEGVAQLLEQVRLAMTQRQQRPVMQLTQPLGRRMVWSDISCGVYGRDGRNVGYFQFHTEKRKWFGDESAYDADGREWTRSCGFMVMNDFGDLVKVPQ